MSYDDTNRGVLFKNKDKKQDTHADYQGSININGVDHWLNAWIKKDKNGNSYMSLSAKPKQAAPAQRQQKESSPSRSSGFDDMTDDIPF